MKTIKDLQVKITYTVGLNNVEVLDEMYDALAEIYDDKNGFVPNPDECFIKGERHLENVSEWISENISENDAMDWEAEIESFED